MGLIVVYRYRPMRVVPTMTTRVVMLCSVKRAATLGACRKGVNRQIDEKCVVRAKKCDILLRVAGSR